MKPDSFLQDGEADWMMQPFKCWSVEALLISLVVGTTFTRTQHSPLQGVMPAQCIRFDNVHMLDT